jgi:hypothetical protein
MPEMPVPMIAILMGCHPELAAAVEIKLLQ